MIAQEIEKKFNSLGNYDQANQLMRFFKTAKGEYGYGDRFLGIRVPVTRSVVKEYRNKVDLEDIRKLINSPWHEIRLCGFLLLIELYQKAKKDKDVTENFYVDFYLSVLDKGNNWDLVDLVAPKILGDYLCIHPKEQMILDELAEMNGHLWHQRVAIVANWTIIRKGSYDSALRITEKMLHHNHDLIHKASGWMLREVGKNGGMQELLSFLNKHSSQMPRTMLRYAIEKLPEYMRQHYMGK